MGDDLDALVWELYEQGCSIRQTAKRLGVDRNKVHRSITRQVQARTAGVEDEDPDDDDDPWSDEEYDDHDDGGMVVPVPLVEPVRFCGREWTITPQGRGEEPRRVRVDRWRDARGQSVTDLDFYRYRQVLRDRGLYQEEGFDGMAAAREFDARLDAARAEYEQRRRIGRSDRRWATNVTGPG